VQHRQASVMAGAGSRNGRRGTVHGMNQRPPATHAPARHEPACATGEITAQPHRLARTAARSTDTGRPRPRLRPLRPCSRGVTRGVISR
jgi:hypothetical protein